MTTREKYAWPCQPEECEVVDQQQLIAHRAAADVWIEALLGDERNSVSAQMIEMMWDDAQWRSLNQARFLARDRTDVGTPGIVASLLDRGYISGQVIAIARLTEAGSTNPRKQVNSLRRLVVEVTAARDQFTREIFVSRTGLPYDWQAAQLRDMPPTNGIQWLGMTGPDAWSQSHLLHQEFDRLSGVDPSSRSRKDLISMDVLDRMNAILADPVFGKITTLRHKSIAHAADGFSRASVDSVPDGISLNDFARAHYLLTGLFQALSSNFLYQAWHGTAVPTPQHDVFEGLEKPIVAEEDLGKMHEFWDEHVGERDDWLMDAYHEIIPKRG